jgi:hypothetical protein
MGISLTDRRVLPDCFAHSQIPDSLLAGHDRKESADMQKFRFAYWYHSIDGCAYRSTFTYATFDECNRAAILADLTYPDYIVVRTSDKY